MEIANFEIGMTELSIALMIFFALIAMFFMGYRFAYVNAVNYANEQIESVIQEYEAQNTLMNLGEGTSYNIGNLELPTVVK